MTPRAGSAKPRSQPAGPTSTVVMAEPLAPVRAPQPPTRPTASSTVRVPALTAPRMTPPRPSPHPLVHAGYWTCADVLSLASQLALGTLQPTEVALRNHIDQLFRAMLAQAHANGIAPEDAHDMQYALVALLDEILVHASWPGRLDWYRSPLQLVYFRENTAGENFFRRASALAAQPHRAHVLLIYFYCLALGFRGRYGATDGAGLAQAYEAIGAALEPHLEPCDPLSPHGEPTDRGGGLLRAEAPVIRIGLAFAAIALVLFLLLRVSLSVQLSRTTDRMHAYSRVTEKR
jgi:type VI secretion system protein ImpK